MSEELNDLFSDLIAPEDSDKEDEEKKRGLESEKEGSTACKIFGDFSDNSIKPNENTDCPVNSPENEEKNTELPKKKRKYKKKKVGVSDNVKVYAPQQGPQTAFLKSKADICFYGGARGGGKSFALILETLRHINVPGFNALILRRTIPEIIKTGQFWDSSYPIYSSIEGAIPTKTQRKWDFPIGSKIEMAGMEREDDKFKYQGASICLLCFDELTHFEESQFWFLLTSNRSTCGVSPYVRCTCNPKSDSWVADLISWWIGPDGYPIKSRSGVIRYFTRKEDLIIWGDSKEELLEIDDDYEAECNVIRAEGGGMVKAKLKDVKEQYLNGYKSFTFIPSRVTDNKILMDANPEYMANLRSLGHVEKEQLLYGNWKIKNEAGNFFNRSWFKIEKHLPNLEDYKEGVRECRFWDFAATAVSSKNKSPDYTVGVKIRKYPNNNKWYVVDVIAVRENPAEIERIFIGACLQDKANADKYGYQLLVRWEEEPGASAKKETYRLTSLLSGMNCRGIRSTKNKEMRAKPFAIQAEAGNVVLQEAEWNDRYLSVMHMFTDNDSKHDDMVDGSSGAFNELSQGFIYPTLDEEDEKEDLDIIERIQKSQEEMENDFLMCNDLDD